MLRRVALKWISIFLLLAGGVAVSLADKIEFDLPSERDEQPIAVQERKTKAAAPSSLNNSFSSPVPNYQPPTTPSRTLDPKAREEWEKKRNWLSAEPSETAPSINDIFKIKELSAPDQKAPTFLGKPIEAPRSLTPDKQANKFSEIESGPSFRPLEGAGRLDRSWEVNASEKQFGGFDRANTVSDFWNDKLPGTSALAPAQASKSQIANILDNRAVTPQINSFFDTSRQPVNPVVGVGAEPFSRDSVKSFTDQWKDSVAPQAMQRSSVLDDFKPQMINRPSTQTEFAPASSTWVKPKPAVLPFPTRPGSLF